MLIFVIECITEFSYVLHKLMWHQSKIIQKKISKCIGFELNVKFQGHVGFLLNT